MNNLEYILDKFKDELNNYNYINDENIVNIPLGSYIKYISKKSFILKKGFLHEIKDNTIFKLKYSYKKWYIYTDKYFIFNKISNSDNFKSILKQLVDSDFNDVKSNFHRHPNR